MQIGGHLADFTFPSGPRALGSDLKRIATAVEDAGFDRLSVMDHVWQIHWSGRRRNDLLEAYTALGFLGACTSRVELLAWVPAVVYREPGLLAAKA